MFLKTSIYILIFNFIKNFQNTFDRPWNEIRMKIQTENFFGILISTRLDNMYRVHVFFFNISYRQVLWFSLGTVVSSTNKTDCHNITEMWLHIKCKSTFRLWKNIGHIFEFFFWLFFVFNITFSNISVTSISWRPVLVVEEAGEDHRPWSSNW